MRLILTLIGVLTCSFALSQEVALEKLWIGEDNNYLKVDKDAVRIEYINEYQGKRNDIKHAYNYFLIGDTLRIVEPEVHGSTNHDFIIKLLTKDELKLISLTPNSRILAFTGIPRKELTFQSQQEIYTDTINFQKILFSSTTCYGTCPAMSFQIDNKKLMKFSGDKYAVKQGSYAAILPDQLYGELLKIIAISDLDKLEDLGNFNVDAATYKLEVHYNNKVKFIKTAFVPYVTNKLLNFLLEVPQKVELKEAKNVEISFSQ